MKTSHSRPLQMAFVCALTLFASFAFAQQGTFVPPRVTEAVDVNKLVTLRGNTHPLARAEFDRGAAPDNQPIRRMMLVLQRSPEQQADLRRLLEEQQTAGSPSFHQWLTPEEFGRRFGPADEDIQAVTDWLASEGFEVNRVGAGRTVIEFSGTAGQVRATFHTEMHKFLVRGEEHWANTDDPQIPTALAPVVKGFASLNNFPRKSLMHRLGTFQKSKLTGEIRPLFTFPSGSGSALAVGPGDFATVYNTLPLWNAGTDGANQSIAIVGRTNINLQDARDFRSMFGLPANDPQIVLNGPDPGVIGIGEEGEADLDVQWSGAVAKGATIKLVISQSTESSDGIDLSAFYIIDNNLAPVMSESFGMCELFLGNSGNAFYTGLWEQASAQGITVLIASGDSGSAGCDFFGDVAAWFGPMVSGLASTPFNVAVGGTDFQDDTFKTTYWNLSNTAPYQTSAKSYIPEGTWNDSCARQGQTTGCSSPNPNGYDLYAAGGGPSNCTSGSFSSFGPPPVFSCIAGHAKPAWQTGTGVPNDTVRDTPDVAILSKMYVMCQRAANIYTGGSTSSCDINSPYQNFQITGGTSAAAPAFAGIMAMVNQKWGRQGNANYVLYKLAAQSGASCTSNAAAVTNPNCVFYDVNNLMSPSNLKSNISVACYRGTTNCSNQTTSGYGIVVVNPSAVTKVAAWSTTTGYDLASGLGSVNAANLVNKWNTVSFTPSSTAITSVSPSPINITHGAAATFNIEVTPTTATGDVSLIAQVSNSGGQSSTTSVGGYRLTGGAVTATTNFLPGGTYPVYAHYAGDGTYGASDSTPVTVTVNKESSNTFAYLDTINQNGSVTAVGATTAPYGSWYLLRVDVTDNSGTHCTTAVLPCPTGSVTLTDNGSQLDLGTYTLNDQAYTEDQFPTMTGGSHSVVANYAGDISYNSSTSGTVAMTIIPATMTATVTGPSTASAGASVTLTANITSNTWYYGAAPTGTVTFFNGGTPMGSPVAVTGTPNSSAPASATASLLTSFSSSATITAQYNGDGNYAASPVSTALSINVAAYTVGASPNSITVTAGNAGSSTITLTPDSGFSGNVTLSCTGLPAAATCTFSPAALTLSGTAKTSTLTISTTANVPPRAPQLRVPPAFRLPFGLPWLAAGLLALAILLSLVPLRARRRSPALALGAALLVTAVWVACGGGGNPPPPPPAPGFSLSTGTLSFGNQNVNTTSAAKTATLTNTGNATLTLSKIELTGTNLADFALPTNTCGTSLAAGANCTVGVTFTPSAAGARSAAVTFTDNASGSPHSLSLTGTGAAPAISLSATSLAFGSVITSTTSAPQTVTVSNTGNADLIVSDVSITGANLTDFVKTGICTTVAAGGNCTISVTFTPSATGPRAASLVITHNAAGNQVSVSLAGTGVLAPSVTGLSFNPATVTGGTSTTGTVTMSGAAPSGGVVVSLSSNNSNVQVQASVTVAAGAAVATFTANTSAVTSQTVATVTATYNSTSQTATVTVNPPPLPTVTGLSFNPATVTGGTSTTGTVTLSGVAPSGGAVVSLSSNNSNVQVQASVTVAAGATVATFTATTSPVTSQAVATVTATYNSTSQTATVTVNPPAPVTVSALSFNPATVTGGTATTGTVTLSGAAPSGGAVVSLSSNNSAVQVPASVTVAAGATSGNFNATTTSVTSQVVATVTATYNSTSKTASVTVNPPGTPKGTYTVTVTATSGSATRTVQVTLTVN